jgi:hypothetical protein
MFGLFCKGLHCAGCGKGIPGAIILFVVGILIAGNRAFDHAIVEAAVVLGCSLLFAVISGAYILRAFYRHGPAVVHMRQGMDLTFCQRKFLETGDRSWLALTNGEMPELPEVNTGPKIYQAEVIRYVDPDNLYHSVLYRRTPKRHDLQ